LRVAGRQESDVDHPGALVAHERIHRGPAEAGGRMTAHRTAGTGNDGGEQPADKVREGTGTRPGLSRRAMLEVMAIASLATNDRGAPPTPVSPRSWISFSTSTRTTESPFAADSRGWTASAPTASAP